MYCIRYACTCIILHIHVHLYMYCIRYTCTCIILDIRVHVLLCINFNPSIIMY